jgi:hypothetical protein
MVEEAKKAVFFSFSSSWLPRYSITGFLRAAEFNSYTNFIAEPVKILF